jgi:hypothetical protein
MSDKPSKSKNRFAPLASAVDRNDIAGVLGAALVTTGLWQVHAPTALIVLGILCLALAIVGARNGNAAKS